MKIIITRQEALAIINANVQSYNGIKALIVKHGSGLLPTTALVKSLEASVQTCNEVAKRVAEMSGIVTEDAIVKIYAVEDEIVFSYNEKLFIESAELTTRIIEAAMPAINKAAELVVELKKFSEVATLEVKQGLENLKKSGE